MSSRRSNNNVSNRAPLLVTNEELLAALDDTQSQNEHERELEERSSIRSKTSSPLTFEISDSSDAEDLLSIGDDNEDFDMATSNPKRMRTSFKRTGRNKETVWEDFITLKDGKGIIRSNKCKRCKKEVSPKACRMKMHLKSCKSQTMLGGVTVRSNDLPASTSIATASVEKKTDPFPLNTDIKSRMKVWKAEAAKKAVNDMDLLIGKMIFSANLPFAFSNNPYLQQLTNKACIPNYKLPSPQRIGSKILDDVYKSCIEINKEKFTGRKVVILQDGWSTNQNAPVICHSIHNGSEALMFDAVSTSLNKKDSLYCFTLLENAIETATNTLNCEIVGVVTDNCNVMKSMRQMAREKLGGFHAYGCVAHILNLCGQEMTDGELMSKIIKIQKFFRNHHFESAALDDLKGHRPMLPGATRWNSQVDTLESYFKNHLLYLKIARENNSNIRRNNEYIEILNNGNVFNAVERQINLLRPISAALDKVQADKCSLADAVDIWIKMISALPQEFSSNARISDLGQIVLTGVALASHMLHPFYRGRGLTRQLEETGFTEMDRLHFKLANVAVCLKALDNNVFPSRLLKEETMSTMSSVSWWRSAGAYADINKSVIEIIESLMILPASSAALERSFSTMGNIITKKRNRLGIEKARKLAVVNKTLAVEMERDESDSDF